MPTDGALIDRIRSAVEARSNVTEKRMFGGVAFMVDGNMACGPVGDKLMVRLGREGAAAALTEPHVGPMDFTGKVISTMVFVEPAGTATAAALRAWVERAVDFAGSLPPKA